MKGESPSHNKIIPVKSLLQNSKQSIKRQYLELVPKTKSFLPIDKDNTPKHVHQNHQQFQQQILNFEKYIHEKNDGRKDSNRGISFDKDQGPPCGLTERTYKVQVNKIKEEHYADVYQRPKTDRSDNTDSRNPVRQKNMLLQMHLRETSTMLTPKKPQKDVEEQFNLRNKFKSTKLNIDISSLDKYSSNATDTLSGKVEEETWNASKFDKTVSSSRDSQPIFKSELVQIKTELFQKEACLFQLSQKLEEKDLIIKHLNRKLQESEQLNRDLQKEMKITRQAWQKSEENKQTNNKMLTLRLKHYEIDSRQKDQCMADLKEREKRIVENNEKIIKGLKELLRQKEDHLVKISQAAQFFKQELQRIEKRNELEHLSKEKSTKDAIIQDLSGELTEIKRTVQQLQNRMREMIENEEEVKKDLQLATAKQTEAVECFQKDKIRYERELKLKEQILNERKEEHEQLVRKFKELQYRYEDAQNVSSGKDFQLSILFKTCEQYKRKIDDYHASSEKMRNQIQHLKEKQLFEDKTVSSSPKKSLSSVKEGTTEEKEGQKLKMGNSRLSKEMERLNLVNRDLLKQIYTLCQANNGLNEEIVNLHLQSLNSRLSLIVDNDQGC